MVRDDLNALLQALSFDVDYIMIGTPHRELDKPLGCGRQTHLK